MESFISAFILNVFACSLGKIDFEKIYGVLSFQGLFFQHRKKGGQEK